MVRELYLGQKTSQCDVAGVEGEEGEEEWRERREKPFTSLSPQSLFSADSGGVVMVRPMILPGENHSHENYCS